MLRNRFFPSHRKEKEMWRRKENSTPTLTSLWRSPSSIAGTNRFPPSLWTSLKKVSFSKSVQKHVIFQKTRQTARPVSRHGTRSPEGGAVWEENAKEKEKNMKSRLFYPKDSYTSAAVISNREKHEFKRFYCTMLCEEVSRNTQQVVSKLLLSWKILQLTWNYFKMYCKNAPTSWWKPLIIKIKFRSHLISSG